MSDPILAALLQRTLNLREERREIAADIREVASEAKAMGYDPRIFAAVVKRAEMEPDARMEMDAMIEAYEMAIAGAGQVEPQFKDQELKKAFAPKPAKKPSRARARTAAWLASGVGN